MILLNRILNKDWMSVDDVLFGVKIILQFTSWYEMLTVLLYDKLD